jgi:hypothetical protein
VTVALVAALLAALVVAVTVTAGRAGTLSDRTFEPTEEDLEWETFIAGLDEERSR